MKMTKKILFGAAALCAAVLFSGCNEIGDIDWSTGSSGDGTRNYSVKQKNEEDYTIRGLKQVGLASRAQGTCVARLKDQTANTIDGMVGFVCDYSENEDDTVNFLVVGVTNGNKSSGATNVLVTYASYFYNISTDQLSAQNFGCTETKNEYDSTTTTPYEIEIVKFPTTLQSNFTSSNYNVDGTMEVAIRFATEDDGSIKIYWYDPTQYSTDGRATASASLTWNDKDNPTKTATVTAAQRKGASDDEASNPKSGKLCVYANIYSGRTLNATWEMYDVSFKTVASLSALGEENLTFGDINWE